MFYGYTGERFWKSVLDQFAGDYPLIIPSLATCLTEECKTRGVQELLNADYNHHTWKQYHDNFFEYNVESMDGDYFYFWTHTEASQRNIIAIIEGVKRFNAFLKSYCEENGHIFVDLYDYMLPKSYEEITADFWDICHFRRTAYKKIADHITEHIREPLAALTPTIPKQEKKKSRSVRSKKTAEGPQEDYRKDMYPIF